MKRTILLTMFLWGICASLQAQEIDGVSVRNVTMDRNGAYMAVDMDVDLSALEVDGNRAVLLTPRIANGADTLSLASIGIYGRRRYLYYIRNGAGMLSGEGEMTYRASLKPDDLAYRTIVPYADVAAEVLSVEEMLQIGDLALAFEYVETPVRVDQRDARTVVSPVFEAVKPLYQNRARVAPPDISDYSAHVVLFFCSGQK